MLPPTRNHQPAYNASAVADALDTIAAALSRAMTGIATLKSLVFVKSETDAEQIDPKDPANKHEVGGLMKLTPRGCEVLYRLFDAGKSRYAVATLMDISFGAATHRHEAWKKLGGANRMRQPLE